MNELDTERVFRSKPNNDSAGKPNTRLAPQGNRWQAAKSSASTAIAVSASPIPASPVLRHQEEFHYAKSLEFPEGAIQVQQGNVNSR